MTVACVTSYHQNVTYPYLIDCGTLRHILLEQPPPTPHSVEQSLISLLSVMVGCTISMFSVSFSLCILRNSACCSVVLLLFHNFISVQF